MEDDREARPASGSVPTGANSPRQERAGHLPVETSSGGPANLLYAGLRRDMHFDQASIRECTLSSTGETSAHFAQTEVV
jgi:hypothetical protein